MHQHYVCGCNVQRLGQYAKWPGLSPRITWNVDLSGYRGNLTPAQIIGAFQLAWRWWAEAVEITPVMVSTAGEAMVRIHFARIDGQSGILAWSELADNTDQPKTKRYDSGDSWIITMAVMVGGIDLARVAAHEIGHVLGMEHDSDSDALLAPFIQDDVPKPTPRDIQRLLALGYKKRTTSLPDPDPDPELPPAEYTIRFKRQLAAGDYPDFVLGSKREVGDYLMTRVHPLPPQ